MRSLTYSAVVLVGLLGTSACQVSDPQSEAPAASPRPQGDPEAVALLEQVAATYQTAHSYRDEGEVVTRGISTQASRTPFSTAYIRPNRFRFEFRSHHPYFGYYSDTWNHYVVWYDGDEIKSWWSIREGVETHDDLAIAISAATGISKGSANNVPSLLVAQDLPHEPWFAQLEELRLGEPEAVDEVLCDVVAGRRFPSLTPETIALMTEGLSDEDKAKHQEMLSKLTTTGAPVKVWVGQEDRLIRQVYTEFEAGERTAQITATYHPELDSTIGDDVFTFEPPEEL